LSCRAVRKTPNRCADWFPRNANSEMTGTKWVEQSGLLEGALAITNTDSIDLARDAMIAWGPKHGALKQPWCLPVMTET
jgi:D-aminopeptidase